MITQKAFPFSMPVQWQAPHKVKNLSPVLKDWLLNTGSLTERLQALTTNFRVELLGQSEQAMDESELALLANSEHKKWQIREVILQGSPNTSTAQNKRSGSSQTSPKTQAQDWVFARSVLPSKLCESKWANLGNQPLGARIFNDDNFVRSEFEIGKLKFHPLTLAGFNKNQECWARRSKFTIENYELLVAEAFLPHSPSYW